MKLTMNFKKIFTSAFILSSLCLSANAISSSDAKALLQKAEDTTAFYETDFKADYEVVQQKPGEGRSVTNATIYRRDKSLKWTILIKAPLKDKGKCYLQTDNSIWFYDPADKRFTFTSSKDKFQGTNANTSDFAPQLYAKNYDIDSAEEVKLGKFDCVLFTLKANSKNVDYPTIKLWVTKDDGLTRMKEDYSLSGQKLRTTIIPSYQKINGAGGKVYWIPVTMRIQDNLKGKKISGKMEYETTLISISNAALVKQDDAIYTKPYLELMAGN
ncbi:MAG: outer membrane lipoprotein-sorting protein [Treponema sp.]|uniref:outer membrane lipoprotein-sorting protein n=1 Tax=Treponema sp. TaxID=166 RepID=UPI0025D22521|nr:outer membrane lipoprotein-sorting protein [Treponema sp.]MBQ8679058.1 outer membrane lipoprotein-sorting protein [Treponema sp.]